jgi:hypothetical protein
MDFMHVTSAGQPPMGTAGMAFTDDALRDRAFLGVAVVPRPSAAALGLTGNISVPVGSSGAIVLGGFFTHRGQALNVGAAIRR